MAERVVINTGPIIAITRMEAVELIGKLDFEFVCPKEVEAELRAGSLYDHTVVIPSWLSVLSLSSSISPLVTVALDQGEAAVIQLGLELQIGFVCIDELKGRRAATAVGLKVVGSLGLIGKAKADGLISSVRPFIQKAQESGIYYNKNLVDRFLKGLGE